MHYRNGREAKNGDKVVQLSTTYDGKSNIAAVGILYDATPGNEYCNGNVASVLPQNMGACMCDCLHLEDVMALLVEKGWDKRPTNPGSK